MTAPGAVKVAGGCLCGAVRYEIDRPPRRATHCHCGNCRRSCGAAFLTWVVTDLGSFRFTSGSPARFEARPGVVRQFCPGCGSQLTYQNPADPEEIDVTAGTLDEGAPVAPQDHVWSERMAPWVTPGDGLPRFRRSRKEG